MYKKMLILASVLILTLVAVIPASAGAVTANGWYEGEEI